MNYSQYTKTVFTTPKYSKKISFNFERVLTGDKQRGYYFNMDQTAFGYWINGAYAAFLRAVLMNDLV